MSRGLTGRSGNRQTCKAGVDAAGSEGAPSQSQRRGLRDGRLGRVAVARLKREMVPTRARSRPGHSRGATGNRRQGQPARRWLRDPGALEPGNSRVSRGTETRKSDHGDSMVAWKKY